MTRVGLLFPPSPDRAPSAPGDTMFGRAALALGREGIEVILGGKASDGELIGQTATDDGWTPTRARPDALVHRFPDQTRAAAWEALQSQLGDLPMVNPMATVSLCRDKFALQRHLEGAGLEMPAVVHTHFEDALATWGAAFLKPRFGAWGEGVERVEPGAVLPTEGDWVLQQAVAAPAGWAGRSCRVLVQRDAEGWHVLPGALRQHRTDPVVNRARGAAVVLAEAHLPAPSVASMAHQSLQAAAALESTAPHTGELGLDFVLDGDDRPWLIEINGKPSGRLAVLAKAHPERFAGVLQAVAERPLRWAAHVSERHWDAR